MINRIIIGGRACADPEQRFTQNGVSTASFTLASDRVFKNAQGEKETDFVRIVAWRKTADFAAEKLGKGKRCVVDGRLQIRAYEQDGQRKTVAEVVADDIRIIDWKDDQARGDIVGEAQEIFGGLLPGEDPF